MLGRKKSIPIEEELQWLDSLDIPVHTQIVLCPEMNDGKHLLRTIQDLYALKDHPVLSVAVVPVGLTKYHRAGLRRFTMDEAFDVVSLVQAWEAEDPQHANFVFLSDEWFLMTHTPVPGVEYYGEYPQLEDGVGMTRLFLSEVEEALNSLVNGQGSKVNGNQKRYDRSPFTVHHSAHTNKLKRYAWINGTISTPIVNEVAKKINAALPNIELKPICIDSKFWGTTNVSGLLTGNDIYTALRYCPRELLGEALIIPSVMLKSGEDIFLDDMHLNELSTKLDIPCIKAWGAGELLDVLCL
jgi:putative radical SAM enzyme (TIGR03279 family)